MKMQQFKTNRRLWIWIAIILFLASWFIPLMDIKGWHASPYGLIRESALEVIHGRTTFDDAITGNFTMVAFFTCVFGFTSILFAWVIQCAVVIIRTKSKTEG
jgi:hypothetical protein